MTCREFMDAAESLTPSQLLRVETDDQPMSAHARECGACGRWMESQRLLGNALQSLSSRTAQREAGPQVEQAVLQAFRTQGFAPAVVVMPEPAAPALWRLSRVFEFGAYAAVAAALIVGVFLGVRVLRDKQNAAPPVQAETVNARQPDGTVTSADAKNDGPSKVESTGAMENPARSVVAHNGEVSRRLVAKVATKTTDSAGFVALMLCDPLICSGDEQVIRMELPAAGATSGDGSASQSVIADVVVGDDGLVRAMRILN